MTDQELKIHHASLIAAALLGQASKEDVEYVAKLIGDFGTEFLSRAILEGHVVVPGCRQIESIPRDGSTIVVGFGRQSGFPVKIVRWYSLKRMWKHYGEWVPGLEANATHWMPLPAAPANKEG